MVQLKWFIYLFYFILLIEVASRLSFVQSVTNKARRILSGGRRKASAFDDLSSRRPFGPCRIRPIRLVALALRYTLPSLITPPIRLDPSTKLLVFEIHIPLFHYNVLSFFLPSSPTWLCLLPSLTSPGTLIL